MSDLWFYFFLRFFLSETVFSFPVLLVIFVTGAGAGAARLSGIKIPVWLKLLTAVIYLAGILVLSFIVGTATIIHSRSFSEAATAGCLVVSAGEKTTLFAISPVCYPKAAGLLITGLALPTDSAQPILEQLRSNQVNQNDQGKQNDQNNQNNSNSNQNNQKR